MFVLALMTRDAAERRALIWAHRMVIVPKGWVFDDIDGAGNVSAMVNHRALLAFRQRCWVLYQQNPIEESEPHGAEACGPLIREVRGYLPESST